VKVELALDAGTIRETDGNQGGMGDAIWSIPQLNVSIIVFLVEFFRMSTYQLVNTIQTLLAGKKNSPKEIGDLLHFIVFAPHLLELPVLLFFLRGV